MSAETIAPFPLRPISVAPKISVADYLAMERLSDTRHEYVDGEILAMAGESLEHNNIAGNVLVEFRVAFRNRACNAYMENVRVRVSPTQYCYPDVVAMCGESISDGENPPALLNPGVIIEILSPSTQSLDRNGKFLEYRELASLTDYVLIAQDRVLALHYTRQSERQWFVTEHVTLNDVLTFTTLEVSLALSEVYLKVKLSGTRRAVVKIRNHELSPSLV